MENNNKNNDIKIGLIIMASGLGKRFGGNKLMEPLGDKPMFQWIVDATNDLFDKRIVVTRNQDVKILCDELGVDCLIHDMPYRSDTVRIGLTALKDKVDVCFFVTADQPLISRKTVETLIDTARNQFGDMGIVRIGYGDNVGSPVGFAKQYFDELLSLPEGKGGNWVVKQHETDVNVMQVDNKHELFDVDTREDLEEVKRILAIV